MPISMSSPSASIVATPVGADCSSSASCNTRSLPHPLDIGLHALALKHKTTTSSGHCTQAATPLSLFVSGSPFFCNAITYSLSRTRGKNWTSRPYFPVNAFQRIVASSRSICIPSRR